MPPSKVPCLGVDGRDGQGNQGPQVKVLVCATSQNRRDKVFSVMVVSTVPFVGFSGAVWDVGDAAGTS